MTVALLVLLVVVAAATTAGLWWRRRNGHLRGVQAVSGVRLTPADVGAPLGERATLVQFTTAFCAPCRTTRTILADIARMVDGVAHIDVDAESHLDLVRRLDVRRTPTVLVLDANGRIAKRASGEPRKADVLAALGRIL